MKIYHRTVQKGILAFGNKRGFPKVHGDNVPIHIHHTTGRRQILYHPDAHFITRHGKLYLFEVLDDELKKENLIIADVILAYLSPNVAKIFFIVPKPRDQDKIRDLSITIYDRLVDMGMPKRNLREVRVFFVLRREARSARKVANLIERNWPT